MYKKFNMTICETSNTVVLSNELQNTRLMNLLYEYDKPLMICLSKLGVKFVNCASAGWIETLDYTKTILYRTSGNLEQQITSILDWVTNPSTRVPPQAERDKQYNQFRKGVKNMIERMFEIVDGE